MKPREQVEASAAAMDRALDAGLSMQQLVLLTAARADQRDLGVPPDLTDPAVGEAHRHPAAAVFDETHAARARRRG